MKKIDHRGVRTWIEVDTKALENNYNIFRNLIHDKCKLMAIAKSNAYGHGIFDYAKAVEKLGADFIGVDSITEAIALQKDGITTPLFILGYTLPERLKDVIERNISLTVSTIELLDAMNKYHYSKKKFKVHLKIDTGMHRQGFFVEDLPQVIEKLKNLPQVEVEGIYTHLATPGDVEHGKFTKLQFAEFEKAVKIFNDNGLNPIRHAAATAGTMHHPESHFDMVRIGMGLMGVQSETTITNLQQILAWRTIISEIKSLPKGSKIGYGLTETLTRNSKIAVLPIGYWHGYPRSLSSKGQILVRGKRCKVLGRIAMDMTVIDITDVPTAKVGDIATIIGKDGDDEISAIEISGISGVYHYEFLTRLNPLIKKFYLN
ncbi:MAG: alanine racemase [Patescibacteria group bacterium]|jgi:alanine racemase